MRKITAYLCMAAAFIFCSCSEVRDIEAFSEYDNVRIETAGSVEFSYDPLTCQCGFNRDRREFRVHTDTMSDYFITVLSEIPAHDNQIVTADITWTTSTNVRKMKNVTFRTVRLEGDRIWLWNSSGRTGLELRILE